MTVVCGDIHADFDTLNKLIEEENPEAVLCCGDFGFWKKDILKRGEGWAVDDIHTRNTKVFFCDGNHEDHAELQNIVDKYGRRPIEIIKNLFYCPRGSVLTLHGKNILFMGGAESIDKHCRTIMLDWFPQETINQKDMDSLPNVSIDIVISHTCPQSILEEFFVPILSYDKNKDPSCIALDIVLERYMPRKWFFGHFHQYKEFSRGGTDFCCLDQSSRTETWKRTIKI